MEPISQGPEGIMVAVSYTHLKLIDIQSRMTEGKGIGYKRWITKHNLKVMAQTVNLLQEKGLTDEDALNQRIAELETKYHDSLAVVKDLEGRMKANKELRYHVTAYANAKSVAQQFKTAKRPAVFEEQQDVYKRQSYYCPESFAGNPVDYPFWQKVHGQCSA